MLAVGWFPGNYVSLFTEDDMPVLYDLQYI